MSSERPLRLALMGDVMTARGIDQILPDPVSPVIHEPVMASALGYVELAEAASGPIPRAVAWDYVWGDLMGALAEAEPDLRIANLETAVTRSEDWLPKGINYRMSPGNVPVLKAIDLDAVTLANNHVLDWGRQGLLDTLRHLHAAGIATAGAGRDREEAEAPAVLSLPGGGRLLLFAFGHGSAGVPADWAAGPGRPGVARLADLSAATLEVLATRIAKARRAGDRVVVSLHWGSNWGYGVPESHRRFARELIARASVDVVFGHSSHHPRPLEIFRERPILFGAGDVLNDYEGIGGYEEFRPELVLVYLVSLSRIDGRLVRFEALPFRIRRFRLERAQEDQARWLAHTLDRESRPFGARVRLLDGRLRIEPLAEGR
ncbi:MAG: CapA family protein [Geminicoccaceae bacterium]|nr:CapA family protein [Geminicoccaceae bacterium]MDW8123684.1 CapA family protein [Geminicoccaceae bacterium]MDW8342410.1 CapA family protein [Geminicoccaceae bacterium]